MTQAAAVAAIAAHAASLAGMRGAPATAPDNLPSYPFAVSYFLRGTWTGHDATWESGPQTYACDIHLAKVPDIGRQLTTYAEYPRLLAKAILSDETLGGAVVLVTQVRGDFRRMGYGGVETAGYHLEIDVLTAENKA